MSIDKGFFESLLEEGVNKINVIKNPHVRKWGTVSVSVALLAFVMANNHYESTNAIVNKSEVEFIFNGESQIKNRVELHNAYLNKEPFVLNEDFDKPYIVIDGEEDNEVIKISKKEKDNKAKSFLEKKKKIQKFNKLSMEELKKPNQKYLTEKELNKKTATLEEIDKIGMEYGLPNKLLSSIYLKETRGNCNLISGKNAVGCFQFLDSTAEMFGIKGDNFDYRTNIKASADAAARYLVWINKYLSKRLNKSWDINNIKDWKDTLGAYNAGIGVAVKYSDKEVHPYKETRNYIKEIMLLASGNGHYVQKGELISDIVEKYGIDEDLLSSINQELNNATLRYGSIIRVSVPNTITVEKGDTLYSIANKYKTDIETISQLNGIDIKEDILMAGQKLAVETGDEDLELSKKNNLKL